MSQEGQGLTRRSALHLAGGAAAAMGLGTAWAVGSRDRGGSRSRPATVAGWQSARGQQYLIGHRGAGDVVPEHTLESYQAALDGGSQCIEVSVGLSRDNVLMCMHDLTLDRTTTLTGPLAKREAAALAAAGVRVPRLGPAWAGPDMPHIPRLQDVLRHIGGKAVLCLEAKDPRAFAPMLAMVEAMHLTSSVIVKTYGGGPQAEAARRRGWPVFAYLGTVAEATATRIGALAATLNADQDVLVIPAGDGPAAVSDSLVRHAVATRVPVWVFPVHRRSEATRFWDLGVQGIITPSVGYLRGSAPTLTADTWETGKISAGQLTRDPYAPSWGVEWPGAGSIKLAVQGRQHFVTMGQFVKSGEKPGNRTIEFDACFTTLPSDRSSLLTIAFGHADDRYYEHRQGSQNGYHAFIRLNGEIGLSAHRQGRHDGIPLAPSQFTSPLVAGVWSRFRLEITSTSMSWTRDDVTTVTAPNAGPVLPYFHIGRASLDGGLALRRLRV